MNNPTPEQLEMYKKLQPKIKAVLGNRLLLGEWIIFEDCLALVIENNHPAHYKLNFSNTHRNGWYDRGLVHDKAIRIPTFQELWGMVGGHKTVGEGINCVMYVSNHIEVKTA